MDFHIKRDTTVADLAYLTHAVYSVGRDTDFALRCQKVRPGSAG